MSSKLSYSLNDYINNPSGKGSAVNSAVSINLDKFKQDLLVLESKNGKVIYEVFQKSTASYHTYFIHFSIPSSTKGFNNDVVFELKSDSNDSNIIRTIKNYKVKFFANDANFVFTYAYTFNKHGVLIKELERKLPFRCINQKPTTRNPDNAMGYSRNIIFAYIVMERDQLFQKDTLSRISKPGDINKISSMIQGYNKREQDRRKIEAELKRKDSNTQNNTKLKPIFKSKSLNALGNNNAAIKISKVVKTIGNTKTIGKIKKSKYL